MERVDDLNQEAIKFNRFQVAVARQTQDKNRYIQRRVRIILLTLILISLFIKYFFMVNIESMIRKLNY